MQWKGSANYEALDGGGSGGGGGAGSMDHVHWKGKAGAGDGGGYQGRMRPPTPPAARRVPDQISFDSSATTSNDSSGVVVQGEEDAAAMTKLVADMKRLESRVAQGERIRSRSDSLASSVS